MRMIEKKTGNIWKIKSPKDGFLDEDGICFYAEPEFDKHCGRYFTYPSIEALREEWEDYVEDTYKAHVKDVIRRYMWEIENESDQIYAATGGDGRKYQSDSHENSGRRQALRDIARELGINAEPVCDYFPERTYNNRCNPSFHEGDFYTFDFQWKRDFYKDY